MTVLELNHQDLIHEISYDYYGMRIASCSSDQRIKVFDKKCDSQDGNSNSSWVLNDEWKAHDASVLKVKWAHPEFGQVIASSSFDRSVKIWEEMESGVPGSGKRWTEVARLVDSRGSIQDIEFAPHHMGLKLATASTDGTVRIYEALDVMNLSHWTLMEEFEICPTQREADGQFCISWCPNPFLPAPMMLVGCGKEFTARVYRYEEQTRRWTPLIESLPGHTNFVYDVAWAPNVGRSYELVATACKDSHVRIYRINNVSSFLYENPSNNNGANNGNNVANSGTGFLFNSLTSSNTTTSNNNNNNSKSQASFELVADLTEHQAEVWRVTWNVTGSILSSAGDDGFIRLWKANAMNEWKQLKTLP